MSDLYFEDLFDRVDSDDVGGNWSTTGTLQLINGNLQQSGTSSLAVAFATQAITDLGTGFGQQQTMGALVACDDDSAQRQFGLVLRSNDDNTDAYWVQLELESGVATLKVVKRVSGSNTTAASATVTSEMEKVSASYDDVYQRLSARCYDEEGAVKVDVYLNDEERPILSATDISYPLHRNATRVGMRFSDNDAGVDGHWRVDNYYTQTIPTQESDFEEVVVPYWNAGKLVELARGIALRDSSDKTDSALWRDLLNMVQDEYFDALGRPDWGEQVHEFIWPSGVESYELPPWVDSHDKVMQFTDGYTIDVVDESDWRSAAGYDPTASGTPWLVRASGRGRSGGLVLKAFPTPSSDTTMNIKVCKQPLPLETSSAIPACPQTECSKLVAGMVHYYTMSDNSRTAMVAWTRKWEKFLALARKKQARRRTVGKHTAITPAMWKRRNPTGGWNGRSRRD